jgi:YidC/Oxa1 family membrane protein insertase
MRWYFYPSIIKNSVEGNYSNLIVSDVANYSKNINYFSKNINSQFGSTVVNTKLFKNICISCYNGSITNISLKSYSTSIDNYEAMPLLHYNGKNNRYIMQSAIFVNGILQDLIFSHYSTIHKDNKTVVKMIAKTRELLIKRHYIFEDNSYTVKIYDNVINTSSLALNISFNNSMIRQIDTSSRKFSLFDAHSYSFRGVAISSTYSPFQKKSFSDVSKSDIEISTIKGWVALLDRYFVSILIPTNLNEIFKIYARKLSNNLYCTGFFTLSSKLEKGKQLCSSNVLYSGPIIEKNFRDIGVFF